MKIELTAIEARVIGCLIEKQITTPDQYPLSLNALVNACNQKSNRDPVLDLDEPTVRQVVDGLARKHFVVEKSGFGSRVPKYQHRFCNTEFGSLKLDPQELAVVCELLLRGPQTPGELRGRASRMAPFSEVSETEATLTRLMDRPDGPFVARLAREPGRRESRYAQLFTGPVLDAGAARDSDSRATGTSQDPHALREPRSPEVSFPASHNDERLASLEEQVRTLRAEFEELRKRVGG
ncbi:MAG TPA: DUF480 domain-containing protein [Steroidobacteraceae bacterium]|nr:DUF480 domain-containing protein [Steroidobacteraceae bacterium]